MPSKLHETGLDLRKQVLHSAVYCGLPATVEGFRALQDVLKERGQS